MLDLTIRFYLLFCYYYDPGTPVRRLLVKNFFSLEIQVEFSVFSEKEGLKNSQKAFLNFAEYDSVS